MTQVGPLEGRRILIVEDDYMVAEILSEILEEAGATVLGPIGWIADALAFIAGSGSTLDGVALDVNLHGRSSYPIADALVERGVGFVFVTGYDGDALDAAYRRFPRCEKPFQPRTIVAALSFASR
jgi:DNA-binding response OmpR family regulator